MSLISFLYSKSFKIITLALFSSLIIGNGITALGAPNNIFSISNTEPRLSKVLIVIAESYVGQGDYQKSKELLLKSIELSPDDIIAHLELAAVYEALDDYSGSITEYKKILELSPGYNIINYYLGLTLDKTGKTDEAMLYLNKAAELIPNNALIFYDIGVIYAKGNDFKILSTIHKKLST